jgi:type VI secretion system protein ImpG
MSESLYPYYERELLFIRQFAQDFARKYPATAGRLLLEQGVSADPHAERLIESCALLAARVQHKLDDEFPELTDALLSVLYPHYLAPVPSMAVAQFVVDPSRSSMPDGFRIEKHSTLRTQPINDLPCRYRTCYPVTLWPVEVADAGLLTPPFPPDFRPPPRAAAALVLRLECKGAPWSGLSLEKLRFHLTGDAHATAGLYELLFNDVLQVVFRPAPLAPSPLPPGERGRGEGAPLTLPPGEVLWPVGFERDEGMLPYPNQSHPGYRLLTEFFTFPAKFLFVDVAGFRRAARAGFGTGLEVVFFLKHTLPNLEQAIDAQTFRLGCTPIINLFEQTAEPIRLTHARYEYRVTPDVAHPDGLEVYSVDSVASVDGDGARATEYQPFYSFTHGQDREERQTFWYAVRKSSPRPGDRGADMDLRLVDLGFNPRLPAESVLVVRTTCTNRGLPALLQRAGDRLALHLEGAAPLAEVRCPRPPTLPLPPPRRRGAHWRLLSHLNLNHLSLSDAAEGRAALQEILRLYDFSDPQSTPQLASVTRHLIDGVLAVSSKRVVDRTGGGAASGFARGVEVTVEFDEQKYVGAGAFLFACVLERFLAAYVTINSFTRLIARTRPGERVFDKWPPRAGDQPLL